MKIVFIGKFKHIWDEEPIAKAFEANNVEVVRIEEDNRSMQKYVSVVEQEKPDFVLFTKLQIQNSDKFIEKMREIGTPSVSWTFDLLLGHPPRQKVIDTFHWLKADYVFLTDGGHVEEYKEIGVSKHLIRQGVPEEFCYMAEPEENKDIIFVGTRNSSFPYRQKVMAFLQSVYGDSFQWIGKDNPFEVRGHDLNKLYANAKIVIGDSMYGDHYWSNRIYEALGRGAFLITPDVVGLRDEFEAYKEFIPYAWNDLDGLKNKIDYFLKKDDERATIKKAGFEKMKKQYLYKHRCKQLLDKYAEIS